MAGKYITAGFNVWYDAKADNVHLTSNDPRFSPDNVHITAKRGTAADANLRAALEAAGHRANPLASDSAIGSLVDALSEMASEDLSRIFTELQSNGKTINPQGERE